MLFLLLLYDIISGLSLFGHSGQKKLHGIFHGVFYCVQMYAGVPTRHPLEPLRSCVWQHRAGGKWEVKASTEDVDINKKQSSTHIAFKLLSPNRRYSKDWFNPLPQNVMVRLQKYGRFSRSHHTMLSYLGRGCDDSQPNHATFLFFLPASSCLPHSLFEGIWKNLNTHT